MKVIITEEVKNLIENIVTEQLICEDLKNSNVDVILQKLKKYAATGLLTLTMLSSFAYQYHLTHNQTQEIQQIINDVEENINEPKWVLVSNKVIGTVYNAVPAQCKKDCSTTANNFRLNLKKPESHRIVAIERTMEKKWGIKQGDLIKVEGTGDLDGIWQVQDRMNKRFAGMSKIDFLVGYNRKQGKWDDLKIYKLANRNDRVKYMKKFSPQLSKKKKKI